VPSGTTLDLSDLEDETTVRMTIHACFLFLNLNSKYMMIGYL
jgi:hypothetical protein